LGDKGGTKECPYSNSARGVFVAEATEQQHFRGVVRGTQKHCADNENRQTAEKLVLKLSANAHVKRSNRTFKNPKSTLNHGHLHHEPIENPRHHPSPLSIMMTGLIFPRF
jgi:hypothetical protein